MAAMVPWLVTLLVTLTLTGAAAGQAPAERLAPKVTANGLLADRLVRESVRVLALADQAPEAAWEAVDILLAEASGLQPDDADLWRRRLRVATARGDQALHHETLEAILRLDPRDEPARLAWVRRSLETHQTLDARLAALERRLESPEAQAWSASVRSRLASDLARGALEMTNDQRAAYWLGQAMTLDRVNPQAARLLVEIADRRGAGPVDQVAALRRWLEAEPHAFEPRARLGARLVEAGAYDAGARQLDIALAMNPGASFADVAQAWFLGHGASASTTDLLAEFDRLDAARAEQAAVPKDAGSAARPPVLPVNLTLLRAALLLEAGRDQPASAALRDLLDARFDVVGMMTDEDRALLAWLAARLDVDGFDGFEGRHELREVWRLLTAGSPAQARERLTASALTGVAVELSLAATYGDQEPERSRREEHLLRAARAGSGQVAGVVARRELRAINANLAPDAWLDDQGRAQLRIFGGIPATLREPAMDRQQVGWALLSIQAPFAATDYLQPITAVVTVRNATDQPLNLASSGPIPTAGVVMTSLRSGGQSLGSAAPVGFDLHRRLHLGPRQSLRVEVRLDRGELGWRLAQAPYSRIAFVPVAVLDPILFQDGSVAASGLGDSDTGALLQRRGYGLTVPNVRLWREALEAGRDPAEALVAIARMLPRVTATDLAADLAGELRTVAESIDRRFAEMSPESAAWTVLHAPTERWASRVTPNIHSLAPRSDDRLVRLAWLVRHVSDPASPDLSAAIRAADEDLNRFARAWRELLQVAAGEQPAQP